MPPCTLNFEPLEPRHLLSEGGLVGVGAQPDGGLSGKIVYVHAGHGYTAANLGNGAWSTQRPETFEMVEDLGNQDQMTALVDYLFRAGATVVPLRPVGHQIHEVVLDNDDPGVSFSGAWSDSSGSVYFGDAGDVPYRFVAAAATETAVARYQPTLPAAGHYPVYTWAVASSNRASDQLYRIHHTGGVTEVTVNHRRVGNGLVYLGTYYFAAGTDGFVEISNRSSEPGRAIIADMIRFGNGMGDIDRGGGISGLPREDEAGLYWVKWHVDHAQGISDSEYRTTSDDRDATVSLSPRYAEYMNRATDGGLPDRVFISFHSNAGGGRGVLGLYNGNNNPATATPNQFLLANTVAREVNDDLVAQQGQFEHNWSNRSVVTLDRSDIEFGEINNLRIGGEFDATIIETGFHDNQTDAEMLRDPQVRDAIGRATYQGLVRYFNSVDKGSTSLVMAPARVTGIHATTTNSGGEIQLAWDPPAANAYAGDAASGFRIYVSRDGYGFDGGTLIEGGGTSTHTFSNLDASTGPYFFKIAAVNEGGEGPASEVAAASPTGADASVLIVNGFDRLDRFLNPLQSYGSGTVERVRPNMSNSFDYSVQHAQGIASTSHDVRIDYAANEAVVSGDVSLADYDAVIWILGEESSGSDTFDGNEQLQVASYLAQGGRLFVSGAEIGWDLDQLNNGRVFYNSILKANYVADDANTYAVQGTAGSILAGLNFSFDDGAEVYDVTYPDVIAPVGGAQPTLSYSGGTGGTAGIQWDGGPESGRLVMLGFPFETIVSRSARTEMMQRVFDFFDLRSSQPADFDSDGDVDGNDFLAWQNGFGIGVGAVLEDGDANGDGAVDGDDFLIWQAAFAPAAGHGGADPIRRDTSLTPARPKSDARDAVFRKWHAAASLRVPAARDGSLSCSHPKVSVNASHGRGIR